MMKTLKNKLNSRGFTLTELLITLIILLMVTAIVAAGIPLAARAYQKLVDASNAQLLMSTTMTELRGELSTAEDIKAEGGALTYKAEDGTTSMLTSAEDGVHLQEHAEMDDSGAYDRLLVSGKAATRGMLVKWTSVTVSGDVVTFSGLDVIKDGNILMHVDVFKVKAVK